MIFILKEAVRWRVNDDFRCWMMDCISKEMAYTLLTVMMVIMIMHVVAVVVLMMARYFIFMTMGHNAMHQG